MFVSWARHPYVQLKRACERWKQRRQQRDLVARAAILLGRVPTAAARALRHLGQSQSLENSPCLGSRSVPGGYAVPPWGALRLAADRPSAEEEGVRPARALLLAEARPGWFSKAVPSPAGTVRSSCPRVGCSGRTGKLNLHSV